MEITRKEFEALEVPKNDVILKSLQDNSYVSIKSIDGETKLYIDTKFNEAKHADVYCEVVKVPKGIKCMSKGDSSGLKWIPPGGIEVVPGDEVLITWRGYTDAFQLAEKTQMQGWLQDGEYERAMAAKAMLSPKVYNVEGDLYFSVPYDEIIAFRRDGHVEPVNGYVILKPLDKKVDSVILLEKKKSRLYAEVMYAGDPIEEYRDYPDTYDGTERLYPGQTVVLDRSSDIASEEELHRSFFDCVTFRAQRRDILAIVEEQLQESV